MIETGDENKNNTQQIETATGNKKGATNLSLAQGPSIVLERTCVATYDVHEKL